MAIGLMLFVVTNGDDSGDDSAEARSENRRIDLADIVVSARSPGGFSLEDGYASADLDLNLGGQRVVHIKQGTPGTVSCEQYTESRKCAVLVDLLGEAVVWFAIVPVSDESTIELPSIMDLVDGYAILRNGWEIRYAPILDRRCDTETVSFQEFKRRFPEHISIIDPGANLLTAVACKETPEDD